MSQHDLNIANQTPISFRADLNSALSALASNNSGDGEPNTKVPNMFWYDSVNNLLKIRNEANDSWIILGNINQVDNVFRPYINNKWVRDFLDEDDLGSDSATSVPSQQSVKAYIDTIVGQLSFPSIGTGQTWVSVSRTPNSVYRNTTSLPIQVSGIISASSSREEAPSCRLQVRPDQDSEWVTVSSFADNVDRSNRGTVSAIIPVGHFYRLIDVQGNLSAAELR